MHKHLFFLALKHDVLNENVIIKLIISFLYQQEMKENTFHENPLYKFN